MNLVYILALAIWLSVGVYMLVDQMKNNPVHEDQFFIVRVLISTIAAIILPLFFITFVMDKMDQRQKA